MVNRRSIHGPTGTDRRQFEIAKERFSEQREILERVLEDDLPKLRKALDEAGVPWTRGRPLPEVE